MKNYRLLMTLSWSIVLAAVVALLMIMCLQLG